MMRAGLQSGQAQTKLVSPPCARLEAPPPAREFLRNTTATHHGAPKNCDEEGLVRGASTQNKTALSPPYEPSEPWHQLNAGHLRRPTMTAQEEAADRRADVQVLVL